MNPPNEELLPRVLMLVGPKGSGKTTLGRLLARDYRAHFVEAEALAKRVLAHMGGVVDEAYAARAFEEIVAAVAEAASRSPMAVVETTGASQATARFLARLARSHRVQLVRLRADYETCAERMATRDRSQQIEVPTELVREMHRRSEALELAFDAELENDGSKSPDDLARELAVLVGLAVDCAQPTHPG